MKLKSAAMVAGFLFSLAVPTLAQQSTPPQPPRPKDALKTILDLTDQQVQQLTDLRQAQMQKIRDLATQIRDLGKQERDLLQSTSPDPAKLGSLILQQRTLRQQIEAANKTYRESALGVLTATQKQKVTQIQEALKLAPQAGPLAAFGLIEGPGPGGPGPGMRFFQRHLGPMPGMAPMMGMEPGQPMGPMGQGPGEFRMGPGPRGD